MSRCKTIGIGEVPRRIIAKAILRITGGDVEEVAGPFQLCAGQGGGCEAAVHAMRNIFNGPQTEAVLLVDASNSINRKAALHNVSIACPSIAPVRLFITGSGEIASTEGTTQGDPLAMAMYAIAAPFIDQLRTSCPGVHQAWYADYATAVQESPTVVERTSRCGPLFGYHPN